MSFRRQHRKYYYFRGDKAFTEDNVLVYNIFISGISHETSTNDLKRHFTSFGEICNAKLVKLKNYPLKQIGFVNFVNAKDAACALKYGNHVLKSQRIFVTACYSWQQPDVVNANQITASTSETPSTSKECEKKEENLNDNVDKGTIDLKITELNDHVLEHVCSFLPLNDQIVFARCCQRFQQIFILYSTRKYKVLDMRVLRALTLWQMRDFFQFCGPYITTLKGVIPSKGCNRIVEFCGLHCTNVTNIHMTSTYITPTNFKKFLNKMTAITKIDIMSLNNNSIHLLSKLKDLKVLRVANSSKLTGKYMDKLIHIEELILKKCVYLEVNHIIEFIKELKNLRVLDMQHCELSAKVLEALVQYGHNIEVLKISASALTPYHDVAKLPKLKHLDVMNVSNCFSDFFGKLAEYKSDQLEILIYECKYTSAEKFSQKDINNITKLHKLKVLSCSIHCDMKEFFDLKDLTNLKELTSLHLSGKFFIENDLLEMLKKCHQLKKLNISKCPQITKEFIIGAVKILENLNRQQLRNYPLCVLTSEFPLYQAIKWAPEMNGKEHILQLHLEHIRNNLDRFPVIHFCDSPNDEDYLRDAELDDLDDLDHYDAYDSEYIDSDLDDLYFDEMESLQDYIEIVSSPDYHRPIYLNTFDGVDNLVHDFHFISAPDNNIHFNNGNLF